MAAGVTITWLGHGTFLFEAPGGERILLDPWIEGNPAFPDQWRGRLTERLDAIVLTHGHFDHVDSLKQVQEQTNAPILCIFDMVAWLTKQGIAEERCIGFNLGGTVVAAETRFTMVPALHSSSHTDAEGNIVYLGQPVGYVMRFSDGTVVYHSGDTCVFGDMRIIGELYRPDVVILPIGGWFTMDPQQAAYAARLIGAPRVIPEHFGTFPILAGTPDELRRELGDAGIEVIALEPGQSTTVSKQEH
ncbi:metal-dependent hydrolase [Kallotenue papyrolyticum]|uniref:metal-dependent hydrolase n=1 Tax=Kallotenue papyrolyticum TaxID=1325125 RepID=UPI000478671A|nr:metal-dependent hydrolase [Kallotenue papyrolyticum]